MNADALHRSVARAASRYNNISALFQWAEEEKKGNGDLPPTTHHYPEVVRTFGGSCLEQLRQVLGDGFSLQYLRSTKDTGCGQSNHYASVCEIDGEEYLVDPNLCDQPVPLSSLRDGRRVTIGTFPAVGSERTQFHVQFLSDHTVVVQQARGGHVWKSEEFDLRQRLTELPGVDVDTRFPLSHGKLILDIALPPERDDREVVRIQEGQQGRVVRLLGEGRRVRGVEQERYLERVEGVLGATRKDLETFFGEGLILYECLRQRRE